MNDIGLELENRNQLFSLMREHPELSVVPMVDSEIIADDTCCWWRGSWGPAEIGFFVCGNERIYFRDDDSSDMEKVLNNTIGGQDWYDVEDETKIEQAYANLPWQKAIIVYIVLP